MCRPAEYAYIECQNNPAFKFDLFAGVEIHLNILCSNKTWRRNPAITLGDFEMTSWNKEMIGQISVAKVDGSKDRGFGLISHL